jgi:hypothetical protein
MARKPVVPPPEQSHCACGWPLPIALLPVRAEPGKKMRELVIEKAACVFVCPRCEVCIVMPGPESRAEYEAIIAIVEAVN